MAREPRTDVSDEHILALIKATPKGMTMRELYTALGMGQEVRSLLYARLNKLVSRGELEVVLERRKEGFRGPFGHSVPLKKWRVVG